MARVVSQESEVVEFKERWTDSALEALAAFANHKGGTVYVGIADDGRPVGWLSARR
jgi:ATP-dependent DNA helicase RecG